MLVVESLTKSFGETKAVDEISFRIERGDSFGLLGPNGAGKTTTISMIVGVLRPDNGQVSVNGVSVASDRSEAKRHIGLVPQDLALYDDLSASANLRFFAALYGLFDSAADEAAKRVLGTVGLQDRAHEPVRRFSGGMKRRLNIAVGLLHQPDLLILDEPTVGVDPQSRNAIFQTLLELRDAGTALLYTTHYMEEVERLCTTVAIMDGGKIISQGPLTNLVATGQGPQHLSLELEPALPEGATDVPGSQSSRVRGSELFLQIQNLATDLPMALSWLENQGITVRSIRSRQATLEEVFLELTGRSLRD
jgi:ABC-2 type transport system ATP-binding protein